MSPLFDQLISNTQFIFAELLTNLHNIIRLHWQYFSLHACHRQSSKISVYWFVDDTKVIWEIFRCYRLIWFLSILSFPSFRREWTFVTLKWRCEILQALSLYNCTMKRSCLTWKPSLLALSSTWQFSFVSFFCFNAPTHLD